MHLRSVVVGGQPFAFSGEIRMRIGLAVGFCIAVVTWLDVTVAALWKPQDTSLVSRVLHYLVPSSLALCFAAVEACIDKVSAPSWRTVIAGIGLGMGAGALTVISPRSFWPVVSELTYGGLTYDQLMNRRALHEEGAPRFAVALVAVVFGYLAWLALLACKITRRYRPQKTSRQ